MITTRDSATLAVVAGFTCANFMGTHRLTYDFGEKGTLRSKMETTQDGKKWMPMFDGVYHRA